MARKQMHLGLAIRLLGYAQGSWRHPEIRADCALDYDSFLKVAQLAESAKFDMLFLADHVGYIGGDNPKGSIAYSNRIADLDPLVLLSALAPNTRNIGLVATASTTFNEPYLIARHFGSLDHVSRGRAGWNVVASFTDEEARNFGMETIPSPEVRHERAKEFVEVVTGLWDGWENDALALDKVSGRFLDADKLHALDHKGKHFSVAGPLTVPRTPQGRPVLVQAGDGEAARHVGAAHADVIYTISVTIEAARDFYKSQKALIASYGRDEDTVKILPAVSLFVGRTKGEAEDKFRLVQDLVHPQAGLSLLYARFGDLSDYPLDGPVPEPTETQSAARRIYEVAKRNNYTIRELGAFLGAGTSGRTPIIGTAADIADFLEEWFTTGAADGFNVTPGYLPHQAQDFADLIVPELQRRGLFRKEYAGPTFRDQLGLAKHVPQRR